MSGSNRDVIEFLGSRKQILRQVLAWGEVDRAWDSVGLGYGSRAFDQVWDAVDAGVEELPVGPEGRPTTYFFIDDPETAKNELRRLVSCLSAERLKGRAN